MARIKLDRISMRFGDFYAVRDISLEVGNGEYVTILGPSGCGKTTLIKVISGIWTPTEGKVYVDGRDVTGVPIEDRDVGYVFQNIALFPMMTLKDNVEYSPRVKDLGKARMEEASEEYLKLVGMFQRAGLLPKELSGGEQQKVAIARALASGSKMLMLDEPLSALDARVRVELRYELRRIVKKLGITVLHVTHDQEEAMSVSDRIVLMRYGSVAESGTPLEMYRRPKSIFAANFIGETNLIECTVSDWSKSGKTRVALRGGREVKVSRTDFRPGDAVVLSVRPEHVYPAEDGIRAVVRSVTFAGTYWRVRAEAESSDYIQYDVPAEGEVPSVGDVVHLALNRDATVVFPRPERGVEEEIRLE